MIPKVTGTTLMEEGSVTDSENPSSVKMLSIRPSTNPVILPRLNPRPAPPFTPNLNCESEMVESGVSTDVSN